MDYFSHSLPPYIAFVCLIRVGSGLVTSLIGLDGRVHAEDVIQNLD